MTDRLGWYGVTFQLALALALGLFASGARSGELGPPDSSARGLALGLLFAVPAAIAAIGVRNRRPAVVVAAAVMDIFGLTLSVATLVFVAPAVLFVAHASLSARQPAQRIDPWRTFVLPLVLVALVVGAAAVLLARTESRCWTAISTPTGTEYRFSPYVPGAEITLGTNNEIAGGCDTGVLTLEGEAEAAALALGAAGLAGFASRRREPLGA